jgi:hypothetical protein
MLEKPPLPAASRLQDQPLRSSTFFAYDLSQDPAVNVVGLCRVTIAATYKGHGVGSTVLDMHEDWQHVVIVECAIDRAENVQGDDPELLFTATAPPIPYQTDA